MGNTSSKVAAADALFEKLYPVNPSPLTWEEQKRRRYQNRRRLRAILAGKKPPKELRATYMQRLQMAEDVMPLYTRPMTPIPEVEAGQKWSPERDAHLFDYLGQGGILRIWLKEASLTYRDIAARKKKDADFAAKFEEAMSIGADALADEAILIASVPMDGESSIETVLADGSKVVVKKRGDNTYARKLAVHARLEILKKRAPEKYGDKISVDVNDKRAQGILAARQRLQALDKKD